MISTVTKYIAYPLSLGGFFGGESWGRFVWFCRVSLVLKLGAQSVQGLFFPKNVFTVWHRRKNHMWGVSV